MGDEQRVSWRELLAQSRDDFEAGTDFSSHSFSYTRVVLGFVCLWDLADAVGYAEQRSRSHHAVILVYDHAGIVIETHEHAGEFGGW
jgi:hypothetical protein